MAKKKRATVSKQVTGKKTTNMSANPDSYLSKYPVWIFSNHDKGSGKWSLSQCDNLYEKIIVKLMNFETMTWGEINSASGGKTEGNNNHFIEISKLTKQAQNRIRDMNLVIDDVYSLRLDGKKRLYGIIEDAKFKIIWYDENHEICISKKRHT